VLKDSFGRKITYLRISVTDRCNLSCKYCKPQELKNNLHHDEILRYEEIERFIHEAVQMGITKVRITGGEPFVRLGLLEFLGRLKKINGLSKLSLTTNGTLLCKYIDELLELGISGLNISLDSLQKENYLHITGHNYLDNVLEAIRVTISKGFSPLKVNTVLIRGVNDHEINDFARLTFQHPINVRFIEYMPFQLTDWSLDRVISEQEIISHLETEFSIRKINISPSGIDSVYQLEGASGRISIIHPVSKKFCATCNRIRLTADGQLKSCLFSSDEFDLKSLLRMNAPSEHIRNLVRNVVSAKPPSSPSFIADIRKSSRAMFQIGG
jgi:cyclic pyranopterin phosphate synthase